ncbi:hypothetical protein [Streptomyces sp. NPDC058758]|uniref:hypothetical protein n=1 Tax=Streptomyces sp. NPDC058758 TaxID=3346627 RepID=UPI0036B73C68
MSDVVNFSALFAGARKFANSAMEANAESDLEVFLLHAGVSIERLAKATLVDQNPVLLLEMKGKEESLFHLAGVKETTRLRTIGAAVALSRLRSMGVLPSKDEVLDELIELRNGVAHLSGGAEETFEGLAAFVRTTNTLLTHLQKDAGEYWGRWQGAVDIALSEHMEKVEREIAGRIESARYRLNKRLEGLPPEAIAVAYANARHNEDGVPYGFSIMCGDFEIRVPRECPACRCEGTLTLGAPSARRRPPTAPARGFHCPLCPFSAWGEDELLAIGVESEISLLGEDGKPVFPVDESSIRQLLEWGPRTQLERLLLLHHGDEDASALSGDAGTDA